jgi:hypothetical protein
MKSRLDLSRIYTDISNFKTGRPAKMKRDFNLFLCHHILCTIPHTYESIGFKQTYGAAARMKFTFPTVVNLRGGNMDGKDDMIDEDLILDSQVSNISARFPDTFQDDGQANADSRDLIIPDTHPTLELALQCADHGDQVFARSGVHQANEVLFVNRSSIHVCGDEQANLLCRWFLMEESWGTFQVYQTALHVCSGSIGLVLRWL